MTGHFIGAQPHECGCLSLPGKFVGRESELERLDRVIGDATHADGPSAGMVTGVPGSGKSRLLEEAVDRARLRVLPVTGYEPEQSVPLTAARDLLKELSRARREGGRLRARAFGEAARGASPTALQLFEVAYRCLVEVAPTVIAVDDVQWIDDISTGLITYLVRSATADRLPLAILAVGRPSARSGVLRDALAKILPVGRLHELELAALPASAGVALVQELAPEKGADEAQRIWERAGGSPFWIEALAHDVDAADATLSHRFNRLSDDGAAMLRAIAVISRPTEPAELAAVLAWPSGRIAVAVRELSARGLAVERAGVVEAAHDLVREAAQRELTGESGRQLHARLSAHLRGAAGNDVGRLREALDHAIAGGEPLLELATEIARAPQRRLIGTTGLSELARLAESADRQDPERAELEMALAELSTELGDLALARERWMIVSEHTDGVVRARALHAAAKAAYQLGQRDSAATLIDRAREAQVADGALQIALDAQEAAILRWLAHRLPEARQLTTQAVTAAHGGNRRSAPQGSATGPAYARRRHRGAAGGL